MVYLNGDRTDPLSQRRSCLRVALVEAVIGVALLVPGVTLHQGTRPIAVGSLNLALAVLTARLAQVRYPSGFRLPDDVDPHDRTAVHAAVKRYRRSQRRR